jgi:hypothetical protein
MSLSADVGRGSPERRFAISEQGEVSATRLSPTGMAIVTIRLLLLRDPVAVPSAYTTEAEGSGSHHPQEVAQAALRHFRIRFMRRYGKGGAATFEST